MLDVSQFVHLRTLDVRNSSKLLEVRGLDKLMYLESLTIESRNSIKRLDLPKFGCLKKLNVDESDEFLDEYNTLAEIQGLDRSEFLERLDIEYCVSIGRLDLPKFGMLKKLEARHCKKLAEIQGLDSLEYLESLDISRCTSIGRLDLPKSGSMKRVNVGWCKKLAEIHGLDRLESLEILEISWCTSIERLLLPKSGSPKRLEARDCKNLVEIRGLDSLEFLEKLNIIGCKSLKTILELSGTQIYRYYQITNGRYFELCPYCTDDSDVE
ncbi:putative adenylate cyclase regulatory protein [Eucalyptus grandis]|uniref:putative adenylate cyclase regulatory protein n=1 Tax=Eucalyptus grandis TaxID=71139 RepID=UPI00192ED988|nr:putative adenylate cyclase regulatory protein [Eucalyptus grandis]XP_039167652.1 putative adenylate cyclase regulatory protein [Eucalyptus grandis]XP_039167653.1 putative adenylate cyclase regulatory protein [Eucalyptus grandis]